METVCRRDLPAKHLAGRVIQQAVGSDAAFPSDRMTVAFARYSDESGKMPPHQHAEETIVVLDASAASIVHGPRADELTDAVSLEAGMILHIPEHEWHVFTWDQGGFADCVVIYGQVDRIRSDDPPR